MFPFVILNDIKCLEMLLGSTAANNKKVMGMFSMNLSVCFFFVPGKNLKDYVSWNQYYPGASHLWLVQCIICSACLKLNGNIQGKNSQCKQSKIFILLNAWFYLVLVPHSHPGKFPWHFLSLQITHYHDQRRWTDSIGRSYVCNYVLHNKFVLGKVWT